MLLESNLFEDIWIRHDIPSLKVGSGNHTLISLENKKASLPVDRKAFSS